MHTKRLAARGGFLSVLVVLLLSAVFVVVGTNARPASAFVGIPTPVSLPATLAGAGMGGGEGIVAAVTGGGGGAAAGAATVAVAPVAVAAAAALAVGAAVYIGWKWKTGHTSDYAAQSGAAPGNTYPASTAVGTTFNVPVTTNVGTATWTFTKVATASCNYNSNPPCRSDSYSDLAATPSTNTTKPYSWNVRALSGDANAVRPRFYHGSLYNGAGSSTNTTYLVDADTVTFVNYNNQGKDLATQTTTTPAATSAAASWTTVVHLDSTAPVGNPTPTITTTPRSNCQAAGGTAHYVTGTAITYTGATTENNLPGLIAPACPAGEQRIGFDAPTTGAGGATVASPVAPWTAPTVPSAFPECNPSGQCQLTLLQASPAGTTTTCNNTDACTGWATQPLLAPKRTVWDLATGTQVSVLVPTDPAGNTYRCLWGPYELKASECTTVPTEPTPAPKPTPTDTSDTWCDWKLSRPWTWPYTALVCAFVPPPGSVDSSLGGVRDAWNATPPGVVAGAVGSVFGPITHLGENVTPDCHGPSFTFAIPGSGGKSWTVAPFDACSTVAQWASGLLIPLETCFLYLTALLVAARNLGKTVGLDSPFDENASV
jgi:hypothetical protein